MGLYERMLLIIAVLVALIPLAQPLQPSGFQKQLNLTDDQLQRVIKLWKKYGPDYSLYQKTEQDYPCAPLASSSVPTTVHKLSPRDVKLVGAMGDSLTAGTAIKASTIFTILTQYRGYSWSGGGETNYEDQITLPNILKKYNNQVYGYATGNGDENSSKSYFNVAVSGSTSSDLVNQARKLIDRMKNDPKVDFNEDWKVVTILTGNNDLCAYCKDPDKYSARMYRQNLEAALDILHAELPRTLVNLVEPINTELIRGLNKGLLCSAIHVYACACAAFPSSEEAELQVLIETDLYQLAVEQIASSGRYDTRDDFTVVAQPFFNGTYLPTLANGQPDMSYFAPDCFHLSRKGQAATASALWNNMIEPLGRKRTAWSPGEPIECPTEAQPYFFTYKNSDQRENGELFRQKSEQKTEDGKTSSSAALVGAVVGVAIAAVVIAAAALGVVIWRRERRSGYDAINATSPLLK